MVFPSWAALPDLGLYMDQVMTLMTRVFGSMPGGGEITKSMVNNYVKAGLIRRPSGKKYDRDQLAQLIMIAVLKQALSMEEIAKVLGILCESGVESGYTRFCEEASRCDGHGDMQDAVGMAILAAVHVMRAKTCLAQL
jgi:hypothetical protein